MRVEKGVDDSPRDFGHHLNGQGGRCISGQQRGKEMEDAGVLVRQDFHRCIWWHSD